jgi:hypothetical protein
MTGGQEDRSERDQKDEKDMDVSFFSFLHISIYVESCQHVVSDLQREIKEVLS